MAGAIEDDVERRRARRHSEWREDDEGKKRERAGVAQTKVDTKKRAGWPKREWHKGSGTGVVHLQRRCRATPWADWDDLGREGELEGRSIERRRWRVCEGQTGGCVGARRCDNTSGTVRRARGS